MTLPALDEGWRTALAVVAHPDDLEYGASCAVARWNAQGKRVAYLLVTSGEAGIDGLPPAEAGPLRRDEQRAAARAVGVDTVEFLDRPDGLVEADLALRRDLAAAVRRHRPELVLTLTSRLRLGPQTLNSADHRAVGLAVADAVRDAANRWLFTDTGLPPWDGVRLLCYAHSPEPTHAVDVTGFLDPGVASLAAHRAYLDGLGGRFDPGAFLDQATAAAGERAGCARAVAFEVFTP